MEYKYNGTSIVKANKTGFEEMAPNSNITRVILNIPLEIKNIKECKDMLHVLLKRREVNTRACNSSNPKEILIFSHAPFLPGCGTITIGLQVGALATR